MYRIIKTIVKEENKINKNSNENDKNLIKTYLGLVSYRICDSGVFRKSHLFNVYLGCFSFQWKHQGHLIINYPSHYSSVYGIILLNSTIRKTAAKLA